MKTLYLCLTLLISISAYAQEPAQLINLRESFKKEVGRVNQKYVDALMKLKETYVRSGNLKAVETIQREIAIYQQSRLHDWVYGEWDILKHNDTITVERHGFCRHGINGGKWSYEGNVLKLNWYSGGVDLITIPEREPNLLTLVTTKGKKWQLKRL